MAYTNYANVQQTLRAGVSRYAERQTVRNARAARNALTAANSKFKDALFHFRFIVQCLSQPPTTLLEIVRAVLEVPTPPRPNTLCPLTQLYYVSCLVSATRAVPPALAARDHSLPLPPIPIPTPTQDPQLESIFDRLDRLSNQIASPPTPRDRSPLRLFEPLPFLSPFSFSDALRNLLSDNVGSSPADDSEDEDPIVYLRERDYSPNMLPRYEDVGPPPYSEEDPYPPGFCETT